VNNSANNYSAPSTAEPKRLGLAPVFLSWLALLVGQQGSGEYIINVHPDGRVTVRRPRAPLRFDWEPGVGLMDVTE
jgi:hypothetical protein